MSVALPKRIYRFGLFEADAESGKLLREGVRIKLQDQPFRMLCILLERTGEIVSREELRQALWPADTFVEFDGSLNATLKRLRSALGDSAENPVFIETLPKRGYRFLAPVTVKRLEVETVPAVRPANRLAAEALSYPLAPPESPIEVPHAAPQATEAQSATAAESRFNRWRRTLWTTAAALALALLVVASYHRLTIGGLRRPTAPPRTQINQRRSVAVLGFNNTSGRGEDAWLSTAFSEMLSTELGAGDQLRLVSGEDVAQLRMAAPWTQTGTLGQETSSRIGASLSGDLLVLGSYASVGPPQNRRVRLDARLQDASTGNILAQVSATGPEDDLFRLASDVGSQLRQRLGVASDTIADQAAEIASVPSNPDATRLYSLGLEKLREFDALPARDLFQQAIKADPQYAPAHAALAEAWSRLGYDQKAVDEAKNASELGSNLPRKDRLFIEARYRALNKEWDKALEAHRALFDFFPDDLEYGLQLANAQTSAGKTTDAETTIQSLRKLPVPMKNDPRIDLAEESNLRYRGQWEPARNAAAQAVEKARSRSLAFVLADALSSEANDLANLGEHDKAIAAAEEAKSIYSTAGDQFGVASALAQVGRVQWAQGQYEACEKTYEQTLAIHQAIGNKSGSAMDMRFIGNARTLRGDLARAKDQFDAALAIYREVGDKARSAHTMIRIAWVISTMGDPASTLKYYDDALSIFRDISSDEGSGEVLEGRSETLVDMGELSQAEQDSQQALGIYRKLNYRYMLIRSLGELGNVATLQDRLDDARAAYSEALSTGRQIGDQGSVLTAELEFTIVAQEQGHLAEARQLLTNALDYLHVHEDPNQEISAQSQLAVLALKEGNTGDAQAAIEKARKLLRSGLWLEEGYVFKIADARVQAATGKFSEARKILEAVVADSTKHDYVHYQLEARLALCEVEAKTQSSAARLHAQSLQKDARAKGFGLIARKAQALAS